MTAAQTMRTIDSAKNAVSAVLAGGLKLSFHPCAE